MADKTFTLIVVPEHNQQVRRFRVPLRHLWRAGAGLGVFTLILLAGFIHYVTVIGDASGNQALRDENLALRVQLQSIRERMEHIGSSLDRIEQLDQKLRSVTLLSDPERNLAVGPLAEPNVVPSTDPNFAGLTRAEKPSALSARIDKLSAEATRQEQSLQELQAYFQDQKLLLASTPSVWPVRGFVTSDFGVRIDPYTADRVMHAGLDIAGPHGKDVVAPSDGTVVFAGLEGGYGNVLVVDHGYGIKTRYGHLAAIKVKAGERVQRGQVVAALGNTGRSTGPHLHYEVRVNGVPQNPRKFILEEE